MKNFQNYLEVVNEAKKVKKISSWESWLEQFNTGKAAGQEFLWINSSPLKQNEQWQPQGVNAEKVYGSAFVWGSGSSRVERRGWEWNLQKFIAEAKKATVVNNKVATIKVPLINPDSNGNKVREVKVFYGTVKDLVSVLEN